MTRFSAILREGEAHFLERQAVLAAEEEERTRAAISEAMAPAYARFWDKAMEAAVPEAFTDPRAILPNGRRPRRRPLREKMRERRRHPEPEDDVAAFWDRATAPFAATAAELDAHRRRYNNPPAAEEGPGPNRESQMIVAAGRGGAEVQHGPGSALARLWRSMFAPA